MSTYAREYSALAPAPTSARLGILNGKVLDDRCGREETMVERTFGEISDYPEGSAFEDRKDLSRSGVHRPLQAGICGGKAEGAESIVLSGGYEDDSDEGDI